MRWVPRWRHTTTWQTASLKEQRPFASLTERTKTCMQALDDLSRNLHILLERYEALQRENAQLREDAEKQRQELIRTHSELLELQQKNRRIAIANAMSSAETAEEATKRINALIAQVDRAIAALKR